jgi:hypothetical protein
MHDANGCIATTVTIDAAPANNINCYSITNCVFGGKGSVVLTSNGKAPFYGGCYY